MSTINEIMEMIYRWEDAADDHLDGALFLTIKSAIDTKDAEIERLRTRLAEIEAQEPLTDEQIERAVDGHGWTVSELQVEDIPGMARDIEAAVLAANNLGVRRG